MGTKVTKKRHLCMGTNLICILVALFVVVVRGRALRLEALNLNLPELIFGVRREMGLEW